MKCALCDNKECISGKDCSGSQEKTAGHYAGETLKIARGAANLESTGYMKKTRLEEVIAFAEAMGYQRIGIAFCVGLSTEAERIHSILAQHFDVYSVCCKVCAIPKSRFGLGSVSGNPDEVMCNPVGQAKILEEKQTELNLIVGLCMGHDVLFTRHSAAPVSTLVVKDRVLAHNPCGAVYSGYYLRRLLKPEEAA